MNKKVISSKGLTNTPPFFSLTFCFLLLVSFSAFVWGQSKNEGAVYYEGDSIRIQQKEKIVTIIGNAFIRKKVQGLKADKIIWYQNKEYAEAFGNVTFLDREQGVLYKGNFIKFFIEKSLVFVREDASIDNRKDKIMIFSDTFDANTKTGSIKARGNTRMKIDKNPDNPINTTSRDADYSSTDNTTVLKGDAILKTTDQWFQADEIDMDQEKNFVKLNGNVRIEDSPEQKKKQQENKNQSGQKKDSLGDSVLTCTRAKIFTETKYLECFENVVMETKSDNSILKSDYFLFANSKEEVLATGDVFYHQKNSTNERYMLADYMKIYEKDKTMYFTNEVVLVDIKEGVTNFQLDCYSMKHVYAKGSQSPIECNRDVILYNPEDNSKVHSDYLFYQLDSSTGYVEKDPYYVDQNNNVYFYSKRMDIDRTKNNIKLNQDVLIVEKEKGGDLTNSTVTCRRGEFLYQTTDDTFRCYEDVVVYMTMNKTHFYGDLLTYYLGREYSRLDADKRVRFKHEKYSTNLIQGDADYVENFHELGYSVLSNQVKFVETLNGRQVNRLAAQEVRYHFLAQSNAFEGYRDVVFINLENDSTLYSKYLFYNFETDRGWAEGQPVLVNYDKEAKTKNLVYADLINFDYSNNISHLKENIYIFESPTLSGVPPRQPQIPREEDYLNCQDAYYYFEGEDRIFECVEKMHLIDKQNRVDIYSDYMIYNLDSGYGFLKESPYLINKRNLTNTTFIYSETMEFFKNDGISLFHTNVLLKEVGNQTQELRSTVKCDDGKYVFQELTNVVECFENVELVNILESYVITGDYLRHQVNEDYSYVSGKSGSQSKLVWGEDSETTVVTADLLESFGEENLLYAKGKVKVDNGENQAESSLGIYEPSLKRFSLYGTPLVRDKEGSEFTSEEVYFDVVNNTMTLGSDVEGNFIPEGFLDE